MATTGTTISRSGAEASTIELPTMGTWCSTKKKSQPLCQSAVTLSRA